LENNGLLSHEENITLGHLLLDHILVFKDRFN